MPGKSLAQTKDLADQIEECQRKIQLTDGDRTAYYEHSQWTMKTNADTIEKYRRENKELRKHKKKSLESDSYIISQGFKDYEEGRKALVNTTANVAMQTMDQRISDSRKKLNRMRYDTTRYQKKLKDLQTQHDQMVKDSQNAVETDAGESQEAQKLRNLENRLDKANLKCREAQHITHTYLQIKCKLEDEHQTFESILDEMEVEIKRLRAERKSLAQMHSDAVISRDAARTQLEKEEKHVYEEKKKRENELQAVRKEAEEKKTQYEKIEKRQAQRGSISQEDLSADQRQAQMGEEEQQKITSYEEMFRRIKEATGVSDTQEVVMRFENQGDTTDHLESLKKENEKTISRLKEEKDKRKNEFEEMKYSGEAKLSSGQEMLEQFEKHLQEEDDRCNEAQDRLDKSNKILIASTAGVNHLAEKLKHLKSASSQVGKSKIQPSSDEYVLDQLSIAEEKLLKLLEELDQSGKDLKDIQRQMEEEEFHNTMEVHLPKYNTRVKLPQKDPLNYEDDEDSGEDLDVMSRGQLKKQAQQLIDQKTKRRAATKKKKGSKN